MLTKIGAKDRKPKRTIELASDTLVHYDRLDYDNDNENDNDNGVI